MQQVSPVHSVPETNLTSSLSLNQPEHVLHLLLSPVTMQQVSPVRLALERIHSLLDFANTVVKCESFRVFVMCLHGLDILSMWVLFFSLSVCDSFCVSTFSLGQRCRSFSLELYGQSTVVFCRSGRDACLTIVCVLCADHVFCYPWLLQWEFNSFVSFGLRANIVEEYVLLNALLHDQSCLQSSPCFQHQFVWLPFSRTLVCKGLCSFHVREHESRVFEPVLRCCVTRA